MVKVTCLSTGTGAFALGPPLPAFFGVEKLVDGYEYSYSVQQGANLEYGRGLFDAGANTLTRGVISSSYGNAPITLTPNAVICFPALAEDLQVPGPPGPAGDPGAPGEAGATGAPGAGINMRVATQTGDATAIIGDANTYQQFTNATAATYTLPKNTDVPIPIATVIAVEAHGVGKVTIAGAAGVTVVSRGAVFSTAGQYAVIQAKKTDTDTWVLVGDLA